MILSLLLMMGDPTFVVHPNNYYYQANGQKSYRVTLHNIGGKGTGVTKVIVQARTQNDAKKITESLYGKNSVTGVVLVRK